jgi:hypothetical protein
MPGGPVIIKLQEFIGQPLLIKVAGQDDVFDCTLQSVDEHGIWVTGQGLLRSLGGAGERFQLLFVSFASIHYLATDFDDKPHPAPKA